MSQSILKATKSTRPTKVGLQRDWYILDASKEPLGRLATKAATILMGKNRADFAPDVNMGGVVVVINSDQIVLTGQKRQKKNYFRHSGRIGSLKIRSFEEQNALDSTVPIYKAIKNMLPKNRHQDLRMNNMVHIFKGDHNVAQKLTPAN
ncbi:MAG: 50S ribosomal protein L13 [candidate division SR1 bacterium]|nr:50S ribosomal protein L13 [candidate division SR1 bacterium]